MFLRKKYKLIKKCEIDFWGLSYLRPVRRTKFFIYLKKLFTYKVKEQKRFSRRDMRLFFLRRFYKNEFYIRSHRNNLVLKERNRKFLRINYYFLFGRNSLGKSLYLFRRASRVKFFRDDLILGISYANKNKKPLFGKRRKLFERQKLYLKQLIFFYNQLNLKKLRKLGYLASKSQLGTINTFFYLLECRIDNVLLRFNLGSRFFVRNFIQAGHVLLNTKTIYSINHIVKDSCYVSFNNLKHNFIFKTLKKRVINRLFFAQPPYYFEINYKILTFLIIPKFLYPAYIPYPFLKTKSLLVTGLHTVLWGW